MGTQIRKFVQDLLTFFCNSGNPSSRQIKMHNLKNHLCERAGIRKDFFLDFCCVAHRCTGGVKVLFEHIFLKFQKKYISIIDKKIYMHMQMMMCESQPCLYNYLLHVQKRNTFFEEKYTAHTKAVWNLRRYDYLKYYFYTNTKKLKLFFFSSFLVFLRSTKYFFF